jgi:DNA adenine methylase
MSKKKAFEPQNKNMKTPITYYGGKQTMARDILPLIPKHTLYCEPFFGGGALFFAKPPSQVEFINDKNGEVINFFHVVQTRFGDLQKAISATLHSRDIFYQARDIYNAPKGYSEVKRAWAFWVVANQSFFGNLRNWSCSSQGKTAQTLKRKRDNFSRYYAERLKGVQIENYDAVKLIQRCDGKGSFFYLDPPYFNSDMGPYSGYSEADFEELLKILTKIKGKFILSNYRSPLLTRYIRRFGWKKKELIKPLCAGGKPGRSKTEVLVWNFSLTEAGFCSSHLPKVQKQASKN